MEDNEIELLKKYLPQEKYQEGLAKLKDGYPVQYIIGNVDFADTLIKVNENVLIPRFETEFLVAKTINYINKMFSSKIKIIDIGTGSGCIAIALKKALDADVTGLDISPKALMLAQENATLNQVTVNFINQDMKKPIPGKYDCLISNPPYIPEDGFVEDRVKKYEPHLALFAADKGLEYYKIILKQSRKILKKKFLMAFEIGDNQKNLLATYLMENYPDYQFHFEKDLNGFDRYLFIYHE